MNTRPEPDRARAQSRGADRAVARWLWDGFIRKRLWLLILALVLMAVEGGSLGAFSFLIKPMFDEVLVAGQRDMVLVVALSMGAVLVVRGVARLINRAITAFMAERSVAEIQTGLLAHLLRLDQGFFQNHGPGMLIERVRGDTAQIAELLRTLATSAVRDSAAMIALLGVALYTDWRWTLIALVAIPALVVPMLALQRLVRRKSRQARAVAAESSNRLDEVFHGIATIQLAGTEARELGRYQGIMQRYVRAAVRAAIGKSAVPTVLDAGAAIGFVAVLIYGGNQIIDGERTVGEFMSFFTAVTLMFEPMRNLSALAAHWQAILASAERVHALMLVEPAVVSPPAPTAALPRRDRTDIEIRDVTFAYDRAPVLQGLTLSARAGQTTAIVGPSGAGKSTVFSLLTRRIDPQSGAVLIGGRDVRQMDLGGLRGLFSVVAQDTALFDETLRDNIVMGGDGVQHDALQAAVHAAQVDAFLDELPHGLDTVAGPRGSGLSGGQRQRVAIARAILRDAPILLLDEATSALDSASEAAVQAALERLSAGRTTLVIAHRLATVRRADRIVVMEAGRVVEQGTHDELLAAGGRYARLHALQFSA